MEIEVTQTGGVTLVVPKGDLDMGTADQMKRTLTELIEKGQSKLVMDLTDVAYVDSSGLGALVAAMKRARAVGGNLKLCGLQEDVRSIFEMTRLIKVMAVHSDRQEAVASW
ncbi:MAG: STAS domain-containing protein [Candidatus Rokubacteria bacterium]|nr:STAS domain-containing protein [Candidatus Rokubacteria bacterium]